MNHAVINEYFVKRDSTQEEMHCNFLNNERANLKNILLSFWNKKILYKINYATLTDNETVIISSRAIEISYLKFVQMNQNQSYT